MYPTDWIASSDFEDEALFTNYSFFCQFIHYFDTL